MALFDPITRLTDANADALNGAKAYFYQSGGLVLQSVYTTSALNVAHANPVVADAGGLFAPIYLDEDLAYRVIFKDADGATILDVDPVNEIAAQFTQTGSGASSRTFLDKARDVVHVRDFGAVGDNTTDDYTAIANAISHASSAGARLIFDGSKTYKINQDTLTFPSGMNVETNGCTLNFTKGMSTNATPAISITGPFNADVIKATVPTTVRRNYGIVATGNDVAIGLLSISSTDQQAQLSASTDYAVKLDSGARFRIGKIAVTNFDRAVVISTTTDSEVGGCAVTSYVRGVWVVDSTNLYVGKSLVKTRSANGSQTAGHNSLLLTTSAVTQYSITIEDFVAENAGEHGIRIGGGPQKNISLIRPRVYGAQACGIKSLGTDNASPVSGEYHENLFIDQPIVEDCGSGTGAGSNLCGILLERANKTLIREPIIRKRDATYSAYYGIRCFGVNDLRVTAPTILDTENEGFRLDTENSGATSADSARINILGGTIKDCGDDGLSFSATDSKTISQVRVEGVTLTTNNRGFVAATGTGGSFTNCFVRAHLYLNTVDAVVCAASGWMMDLYGDDAYGSGTNTISNVTATNSSRWSNETSFYTMKAGTWTAV